MTRRWSSERGAATVFALAVVALLVLVAVACGVAVAVFAGHRRAEAAADLAALAGARALQGGADPCGSAQRMAVDNGAALDSCAVDGPDVVVTVHITLDALGRVLGSATPRLPARARAGPVG